MSLMGDVLKKMTSAAAELGEAVVDGLGDLAESLTGKNAITKAARAAGRTFVRGTKEIADATIDVGEAIYETIVGRNEADGDAKRCEKSTPQAPDFVEPAQS